MPDAKPNESTPSYSTSDAGVAADAGIELRPATEDDYGDIFGVVTAAFGEAFDQAAHDLYRRSFQPDRSFVAVEAGRIVASIGAGSLELSLPGRRLVDAGAIGWAGVLPTHRRRGTLRRLMQAQLEEIVNRGEPLALLHASEGGIYGRFGFAPATRYLGFTVDTRRAAFTEHPPVPERERGRLRLIDRDEALELLPSVFDGARLERAGQIRRRSEHWEELYRELDVERKGGGLFFVVHETPTEDPARHTANGYAVYWIEERWEKHVAHHTAHVREMVAEHPEARRALWEFALSLDLVETVSTQMAPPDEPLEWMLTDPRAMRVNQLVDGLHVRILDVPAALEARGYAAAAEVVLEVRDRSLPTAGGRFRLRADVEGASCERTEAEPQLIVEERALAAAYLGGERFSRLRAAGLARALEPGALQRADGLFATQPAPWTATIF